MVHCRGIKPRFLLGGGRTENQTQSERVRALYAITTLYVLYQIIRPLFLLFLYS